MDRRASSPATFESGDWTSEFPTFTFENQSAGFSRARSWRLSSWLGESHLDIQLGKFRLAVGAQVLVAEAPYNLEITIEARNHQKLLEELGGLRQGVKAPVLQAAGHEVVPRAFGR